MYLTGSSFDRSSVGGDKIHWDPERGGDRATGGGAGGSGDGNGLGLFKSTNSSNGL